MAMLLPMRPELLILLTVASVVNSGCATRSTAVESRMILPDGAARTEIREHQAFIMAIPIRTEDPVFPTDEGEPREASVCVEFQVSGAGEVNSIQQIDSAPNCDQVRADNAPYATAAKFAVSQWSFIGAAICDFKVSEDECDGAEAKLTAVPIKLAYRFHFRVENGRRSVRSSSVN